MRIMYCGAQLNRTKTQKSKTHFRNRGQEQGKKQDEDGEEDEQDGRKKGRGRRGK